MGAIDRSITAACDKRHSRHVPQEEEDDCQVHHDEQNDCLREANDCLHMQLSSTPLRGGEPSTMHNVQWRAHPSTIRTCNCSEQRRLTAAYHTRPPPHRIRPPLLRLRPAH